MIEFDRSVDKVAIVAPASGYNDSEQRLDVDKSNRRLQDTIELFTKKGFTCTYDDKIFASDRLGYFSAPKAERFRQFKDALEDPSVKIISAFRGGYGCAEIAYDLMNVKPTSPKILIGFSDITVLHALFSEHYDMPSIHGAVTTSHKDMIKHIISILEGKKSSYDLTPVNNIAKTNPEITGKIVAGNLAIISTLIGTPLSFKTEGKILLIEDIAENGYKVHRYMMHMKNAGLLENLNAVVFGDFTKSDAHLEPTIKAFCEEYLSAIPAYRVSGIGHGLINYPITIGGVGVIKSSQLIVENPFGLV